MSARPIHPRPRAARSLRFALVGALVVASSPALHVARVAAAPPVDENAKRAREAYAEGQAAFNLGQWEKAVEAWQRGYKLKQDPLFLYNIAQAYRQSGNAEQAAFHFKSFLRNSPMAANRAEVQSWIDQLERQAAEERQHKADEEAKKQAADEQARRDEAARQEAARAAAAKTAKARVFNGDIGLRVGVNLWASGLRDYGVAPSAAVELSGGYTLVRKGRLSFRLGATVAFTYLLDVGDTPVNLLGLMVDPTLKIDLWKQKLFFIVELGLGAGIIAGLSSTHTSALIDDPSRGAKGTFAAFEARPQVGIEYLVIPRLSVLLTPGVAILAPAETHIPTGVRVQVLAGIQAHL